MKSLRVEALSALAVGCVGHQCVDEAWRPSRMPAPLQPIFQETEAFAVRMACPAGVRLRFHSDTATLAVRVRFGVRAREIFQFSLLVDGQQHVGGPQAWQAVWDGELYRSPQQRRRRLFDLFLPTMAQADVLELRIDDDATVTAAPLPRRWLAYGDSITQGMTAQHPARTGVARAALALDAEVFNLGIGGAICDPRFAEQLTGLASDVATIAYGTNEFNRNIAVQPYQASVAALVAALQREQPQRPIVILTPPPWVGRATPNDTGATLQHYRDALAELAAPARGIHLLDGRTLVPDESRWYVDDVHPNDEGFAFYGERLTAVLRDVMNAGVARSSDRG